MNYHTKPNKKLTYTSTAGYTLLETIIIVTIVGILSAIIAPSWLNFIERQRLNTAQDQVYRAMQEAKSNATKDKITWQVSFREENNIVQWTIHPATSEEFMPNNMKWNSLDPNIQVYKVKNNKNKCETTLYEKPEACPTQGPWRIQFNYHGNTNGQLGKITLISKNGGNTKRCVYISTLIGAMRKGEEHSRANNNDKYCY
jgi:type II secretory pathway pseudopilin PulG